MAMDPVIQIEQLRKKFCGNLRKSLWYGMQDIGSEIFGLKRQSHALRKEEFWALKDISFSIRQGESVGLIGSNGAGKSTLLRVISGLIKPDQGSVKVKGRVAPLIALGAGFNPVLTGRENIFVNMSILGLTPEQIKSRFDEVVEFSGLEHALDMPVQTYSSGMAARLGFSCAIFTTPDILLIDEVLAVGDLKFRARCYRKLAELKKSETTFIMVSHNPQSILSICDVGMYLKKGVLMGFGTTQSIMQQYEADLANLDLSAIHSSAKGSALDASAGFRICEVAFYDQINSKESDILSGEEADLVLTLEAQKKFTNLNIQIYISDAAMYGERTLYLNNSTDGVKITATPGIQKVSVRFPYLGLNPGLYSMKVAIYQDELFLLDVVEAFNFVVKSNHPLQQSLFYQPRQWKVNGRSIE
jgi:lipopolysaccharide transport system ATP-binding protein